MDVSIGEGSISCCGIVGPRREIQVLVGIVLRKIPASGAPAVENLIETGRLYSPFRFSELLTAPDKNKLTQKAGEDSFVSRAPHHCHFETIELYRIVFKAPPVSVVRLAFRVLVHTADPHRPDSHLC